MSSHPTIHLASLGCAKNLVDSERLLARLAESGGLVGAPPEEADVILVNTCGFIAPARRESMAVIAEYAVFKEADPQTRIFVVGCLVEREREALRTELPFVDGFFGLGEQEAIVEACGLSRGKDDGARLLLTPAHTAYLRISDGCDNRCAYCTIPLIRGGLRSRRPHEILREAEDLVANGVRELNVIGQDTTSYGRDLPESYPIDRLLREIAEIEDLRWLRLLYAHPAHFSDDLVETFAETPKLCPYIDLPLQHLDDGILRRMGRRVTQADCIELIATLRERLPDVAIRTTFIVGFPGESASAFQTLVSLVKELQFEHLGAFAYSREPGTPAAEFPDQIPEAEKDRRVDEVMRAQQTIAFARNRARMGEQHEVILDGPTDEPNVWVGRTQMQAPDVDSVTLVRGRNLRAGQFLDVRIADVDGYDLIAEPSHPNAAILS
jgi:ribosomal protein S12 methylthiotransferase